jgi:hypothetical protein
MATIKFKRTTTSTTPTGLTFGEPAFVQGINSFYVTNSSGTSVRVGAEVDTNTSLGSSDNKIPTQNAVKTYVDNNLASGAVTSVSGVTGAVSVRAGTGISIAVGSGADKGITFTNTGVQSLTLSATLNGGLAVSGAGTTGALTKNVTLDFANLTAVTPVVGDLVPIGDASDSNNPKDVTVGGILDLISGDVNVDSNGASSIANGAIVDLDIASNAAITVTKLAAFTISGHTLGNNLSTLTIGSGLGGSSYNGSAPITITNNGVTGAFAGSGISVSSATGNVTISNTGVTGIAAGTGISVSASTGNVTITNTGVQSLAGTTNQITVTPSGGTGALTLSLPSAITTPGSLTVSGDLTVNGTTTTVNSTTLSVEDPLIQLAKGNSAADSLDIGIYGLFDTAGTDKYTGLFRDASDGKWRLFTGLESAPTTTVNIAGTGYTVATLVANLEGTATNATNVAMLSDTSDTTTFLAFVNAASDTNQPLKYNSGLGYNASTNALTATTFVGALSGNASTATNATNATNVIATEQTTGTYYLVGMASAGTTGGLLIDATATIPLSYAVGTGTLTCVAVEAIVDGGSYT